MVRLVNAPHEEISHHLYSEIGHTYMINPEKGTPAYKAGFPFLVIADFQTEEDGVRALLDDLKVGRNQYVVRRSDLEGMDRPTSLTKVLREFAHYNTYPIDPSRPAWLAGSKVVPSAPLYSLTSTDCVSPSWRCHIKTDGHVMADTAAQHEQMPGGVSERRFLA